MCICIWVYNTWDGIQRLGEGLEESGKGLAGRGERLEGLGKGLEGSGEQLAGSEKRLEELGKGLEGTGYQRKNRAQPHHGWAVETRRDMLSLWFRESSNMIIKELSKIKIKQNTRQNSAIVSSSQKYIYIFEIKKSIRK